MLHVTNLAKQYGDTLLFEKANFILNAGERVGLVGPNGCGKTTLLRILIGEESPDQGAVHLTVPRHQLGYLPQALKHSPQATVRQILAGSTQHDQDYWAEQVEKLAVQLASPSADETLAIETAYSEAVDHLSSATTRLAEYEIAQVLAGLEMNDLSADTLVNTLSGGQKTRIGLARLLIENPSLLLLDEPTNHLDISALGWLERYLAQYRGAVLIVSHDRTFIDHTVNRIIEMSVETRRLTIYEGNYTQYLEAKERERGKHALAFKNQQRRVHRLESAIRGIETRARNIENETVDFHYRKQALKIARRAVTHKARLERMLASKEYLEKPRNHWDMKLEFVETPVSGQDVLILDDVSKSFGDHLLFEHASLVLRRAERIALLGPNGCGKTTLLRMIVGQEQTTSGSIRLGANVQIGYFSQEQGHLDRTLTPFDAVRREAALSETDARRFLHLFLFAGDEVFAPIEQLSYGERARLALGVLVLQGCNLLLLDEPINHLDIPSRESFEQALQAYEGTVLSVVHDRYFVKRYATGVWAMHNHSIRRFIDLEDTHRVANR